MYNFTQKHLQLSHRSELCQIKHVFRKHQSWPDNFFPRWVPYFTIFTPLKWNGGPGWVTIIFNMHWGILGAILSISPKARLVFRSLFVLKSWLSCFRGTATYHNHYGRYKYLWKGYMCLMCQRETANERPHASQHFLLLFRKHRKGKVSSKFISDIGSNF